MKHKKILPLALMSIFTITSCGGKSYQGEYMFQMGRDNGVHMNATIALTGDAVTIEGEPNAKKFKFTCDIVASQEEEEGTQYFKDIIEFAYILLGDGESVNGYYSVGDTYEKDKKHLTLGFVIGDVGELIPGEIPTIKTDITESVMFATIDTKAVYITVPVSLTDLMLQLYWYGYDVWADDDNIHLDTLPEEKHHAHGSHPNTEDVAYLNADPTYVAHHKTVLTDKYDDIPLLAELFGQHDYRDFHTLTVSLLKV